MSREVLNIENCLDEKSIDERIAKLNSIVEYGNDLSQEASHLRDVLEERKRSLRKRG